MTRHIVRLFAYISCVAVTISSCINDDSSYGKDYIAITVSGIESSYDIVTFNNQPLIIEPKVSSVFDEADLTYKWSYYNTQESLKRHTSPFKAIEISKSKNLNYDIGFPDGSYTFIFTVTSKSTGYSVSTTTQIYTASLLSRGFIILKENADGNTDIDIYNTVIDEMIPNMFVTYNGEAIAGKPRSLDVIFNQAYMNPETDLPTGANLICITTDANIVKWISLQGLTTVMDNASCHYDEVKDEVPYRTVQGMLSAFYFTNNGVYSTYTAKQNVSGVFGTISGNGGSTHVVSSPSCRYQMVYWNEKTHSICYIDFNGTERTVESEIDDYPVKNTTYDCIASGQSHADGEIIYFVLQSRTHPQERVIYYIGCENTMAKLLRVEPLPATKHMAHANLFAVNGSQATVAYCVDNNRVYSYDISGSGNEREITFEGLPQDETIAYISNRYYWGMGFMFNYLAVGTQNADGYKLYLYNLIGEDPTGLPDRIFTGIGNLKSFNYIDPEMTDEMAALSVPITDH